MSDDANQLLNDLQRGDVAAKRSAALRLGMMHNPLVVPDLLRAADTPDQTLRTLIASAVARNASLETVRAALRHRSTYVRLTAIAALRHMSNINDDVVADWITMLTDESDVVQRAAAEALREFDRDDVQTALEQWQRDRTL
jgi:HEAT repeat protein